MRRKITLGLFTIATAAALWAPTMAEAARLVR
jgi:hypothetical protein